MTTKFRAGTIIFVFAALAWIAAPVYSTLIPHSPSQTSKVAPCPSGRSAARLTGWMLNDKMPVGTANYDAASQRLEVSVSSVGLPDGRQLAVLAGDNRIGELKALSGGSANVTINKSLKEGSRVRVLDDDRPVVSGNLVCDNSQPAPTIPPTPSPTVSPTPEPTATPSPTPMPSPTLHP